MEKVLITGITGQDGSYMAEYCLEKGLQVFGLVRLTSSVNDKNFKHLLANPNFQVIRGDITDPHSIESVVNKIQPDYFINLAAQSFVGDSWKIPQETFEVDAVGVLNCLEAIKKYAPNCRFYNAGSSEQFGDVSFTPQNETHPFKPRSPYGAAKCAAHHLVKVYRESYRLYAVQGLLFNHESERRGEQFVTRKITKGIARIFNSIKNIQPFEPIRLGNLDAKRDWSHAKDFVDGIWRMLNQDEYNENLHFYTLPNHEVTEEDYKKMWNETIHNLKEYVLASGETHTVREFVDKAMIFAGLEGIWTGVGVNEKLVVPQYLLDTCSIKSSVIVEIDPQYYRPAEVDLLLGDPMLAHKELGWKQKISFDRLVSLMVSSDINEQTQKS